MEIPALFVRSMAIALSLTTASGVLPAISASAAETPIGWSRPVPGRVVHGFDAPKSRYGAGHRGVDFKAAPGTPVRAPRDGVVAFAGQVGGSLHVVIDHGHGIRTSMSFLATVSVRAGARVRRDALVGSAGGVGPEHNVGRLHFAVRVGETYVDPMALFRAVDLAAVIHLVPTRHQPDATGFRTRAGEARSLADALHIPAGIPGVSPEPEPGLLEQSFGIATWPLGVYSWGGSMLAKGGGVVLRGGGRFAAMVLSRTPFGVVIADLRSMGGRFLDYLDSLDDCTTGGGAGPGGGGSGHRLMAVGGINSSTNRQTGRTLDLDTNALGYERADVEYFSYAADGGIYEKTDTYGNLVVKAHQLRDQLRAMQHAEPGREVDLVAHSQGGVVVDAFLQLVYDPADVTLPPIGTVVTLSSPHLGAAAATVAAEIRSGDHGRRVLDFLESATGEIPPSAGRSTQQLAEDSRLMRRLWSRPLPDQVEMTSVGADQDPVVTADVTQAPGARSLTVSPDGWNDHSAIVSDPTTMTTVRLILERRPPKCVGLVDGIQGAVQPVLIHRAELTLGKGVSQLLDR